MPSAQMSYWWYTVRCSSWNLERISCLAVVKLVHFILFFYEGRYARGHLQIQIFYGRTIYFRGGGWKNKKSLIWKAFVQETLQKLCRKKKVKKVANSGELCISFPIAARPCTVVGRCGMIPVLKSQQPSESLGFATRIEFQTVPVLIGLLKLLSVPSIRSSKGPVFGPAKMQEPFRSHIGQVLCEHLDRFVLVPTA